jgi:hypothetical protein
MLAVVVAYAQTPNRDEPPFRVTRYDVQLEPRLGSRTVVGTATLSVVMQRGDVASADTTITLDRGRLEIDGLQEGASSRAFVGDGTRVRIFAPSSIDGSTNRMR